MKELITQIVKCLVDAEESVVVNEVVGESTIIIEISAAKEDMGKIIGKEGSMAKAMRTILKTASKKYGKKYILTIL